VIAAIGRSFPVEIEDMIAAQMPCSQLPGFEELKNCEELWINKWNGKGLYSVRRAHSRGDRCVESWEFERPWSGRNAAEEEYAMGKHTIKDGFLICSRLR